jgi:hypothetical protein
LQVRGAVSIQQARRRQAEGHRAVGGGESEERNTHIGHVGIWRIGARPTSGQATVHRRFANQYSCQVEQVGRLFDHLAAALRHHTGGGSESCQAASTIRRIVRCATL